MRAMRIQVGMGLLLWMSMLSACGSSGSKGEPSPGPGSTVEDAGGKTEGPDAGDAGVDGGSPDGGAVDDGGTDGGVTDGGVVVEGPPCEKSFGVCAGAKRAWVDGAYESECTALSYGSDYEAAETRCDGLDNNCDGVTDPPSWSRVAPLGEAPHAGLISSIRTETGVLVAALDSANEARILRLDANLVLQGTASVSMPWVRTGTSTGVAQSSRLVRTEDGLALYYSTMAAGFSSPLRAYLVPLDGAGAPTSEPGGALVEYPLLDRELDSGETQVAVSPAGDRVVVLWRSGSEQSPPLQVMGTVVDARGQVLTAPKALFTSLAPVTPHPSSVLWLRNGEVLVAMRDEQPGLTEDTVRLRRFDVNLDPLGEERTFTTANSPLPLLVDRGEMAGEPLVSPVLVLRAREAPDFRARIQVTGDLFEGGTPSTWTEEPEGSVPWYGAYASEGVLRLAWLAKLYEPGTGGGASRYWGRLWTQDAGDAAVERTPDLQSMSVEGPAQWVLMENVAPRRMAALYMVSTEEGRFLDAVRYCTP